MKCDLSLGILQAEHELNSLDLPYRETFISLPEGIPQKKKKTKCRSSSNKKLYIRVSWSSSIGQHLEGIVLHFA